MTCQAGVEPYQVLCQARVDVFFGNVILFLKTRIAYKRSLNFLQTPGRLISVSGRLISVMSHCDVYRRLCYISDIHKGLCHIVIFVKGYVNCNNFQDVTH